MHANQTHNDPTLLIINEILPARELCERDNTSLVPEHTGKKYLTWLLIGQMAKWKYNTMTRPIYVMIAVN